MKKIMNVKNILLNKNKLKELYCEAEPLEKKTLQMGPIQFGHLIGSIFH